MLAFAGAAAERPNSAPQPTEARACALLIEHGRPKPEDLAQAERLLAEAPESRLTPPLARLGLVSERDLADAWSRRLHLPLLAVQFAPSASRGSLIASGVMQGIHPEADAEPDRLHSMRFCGDRVCRICRDGNREPEPGNARA